MYDPFTRRKSPLGGSNPFSRAAKTAFSQPLLLRVMLAAATFICFMPVFWLLFGSSSSNDLPESASSTAVRGRNVKSLDVKEPPIQDCCTSKLNPLHGSRCIYGSESDDPPIAAFSDNTKRLKIGFVTYATGPYNAFLPGLWDSIQTYAFAAKNGRDNSNQQNQQGGSGSSGGQESSSGSEEAGKASEGGLSDSSSKIAGEDQGTSTNSPSPHHDRHLFIFTDQAHNASFLADLSEKVHLRYQERLGWPFDSLGRHFLYLRNLAWFSDMDYIFSIDVDAAFVGVMDERSLGKTVASMSAWPYGFDTDMFKYDKRLTYMAEPYSAAYMTPADGTCYFAGGLFGGDKYGFAAILRETTSMALQDIRKFPPRIALWHDESYLNSYFAKNAPDVVLGPAFMYPEPPSDSWLYTDTMWPKRTAAWHKADGVSRRFEPKILNLGVRKVELNMVNTYQSRSTVVPAILASGDSSIPYTAEAEVDTVLEEVTFIIKAFERPTCLQRLLDALSTTYANARVLVLDDSKSPLLDTEALVSANKQLPKLRYMRAAYDSGLAAGRNIMVDAVETAYVMLLDDDFVVDARTKIELLVDAIRSGNFDIVGGCIDSAWSYSLSYQAHNVRVRMDVPCLEPSKRLPDYDVPGLACWRTDMINNFFLARTEFLKKVRWDPRLKMGEHEDFYMRVQAAGGQVGLCRGVTAVNDNSCDASPEYKKMRSRVFDFWISFFKKWGIRKMRTEAGEYTLECEDDTKEEGEGAEGINDVSGGSSSNNKNANHNNNKKKKSMINLDLVDNWEEDIDTTGCRIKVDQDNIWFA